MVGQRPIRAVDVSADEQHVWTRWELPWTPAAGRHELLARATDRAGLTQPDQVPLNQGGHYRAVVRYPVTAA